MTQVETFRTLEANERLLVSVTTRSQLDREKRILEISKNENFAIFFFFFFFSVKCRSFKLDTGKTNGKILKKKKKK